MTWPGSCVQPLVIWVAPSSQCMASRDTRASPLACLSRVTSRDSHKWRACPRKILEILVGTSNGTDHFGLVLPEYSGPDLKVVHFDRSGARFSKVPVTLRARNQIFKSKYKE